MNHAFIPYGLYWSTPFAKWQGALAHLNSLRLAAHVGKQALEAKQFPMDRIDHAILGMTNPQHGSFYGLPWVTGMMGLENVTGPTVQQACATSARGLQMAAAEISGGTAACALLITADRCSNGPIVYYPDPTAPGGTGITERWVLDNFALDPHARNSMLDTAENVAAKFGISTAQQHEVALMRYAQYQHAVSNERAFQRRYMVDVPITDAGFRKRTGTLSMDEGIFATSAEGLAKLRPVRPDGSVTFGSQTHPADGNAGIIVATADIAREYSLDPNIVVELLGFGQARVQKGHMPMAVAPAANAALKQAGLSMKDVDAVKTHNPFAVNDIAFARETGFSLEQMNNYGCSLIWGHPQGPTGLRSVIELIEELAQRGGGTGLFGGCAAGDSGMALVLRVGGRQAKNSM
jgi:acetyl-CoA acetyltransferase family protein